MADFAPSPLHGAAYAVAIETVGGIEAIGGCADHERYAVIREKLDGLRAWAATQTKEVRAAYVYGIEKVDADALARLKIHQNSNAVMAAMITIPRPSSS